MQILNSYLMNLRRSFMLNELWVRWQTAAVLAACRPFTDAKPSSTVGDEYRTGRGEWYAATDRPTSVSAEAEMLLQSAT